MGLVDSDVRDYIIAGLSFLVGVSSYALIVYTGYHNILNYIGLCLIEFRESRLYPIIPLMLIILVSLSIVFIIMDRLNRIKLGGFLAPIAWLIGLFFIAHMYVTRSYKLIAYILVGALWIYYLLLRGVKYRGCSGARRVLSIIYSSFIISWSLYGVYNYMTYGVVEFAAYALAVFEIYRLVFKIVGIIRRAYAKEKYIRMSYGFLASSLIPASYMTIHLQPQLYLTTLILTHFIRLLKNMGVRK